jgi:hypothetical protein
MNEALKPYIEVLRKIYARLEGSGINWALTGSLSFALQGIPVRPRDIDIQTDKAGAYKIEKLFSNFVVSRVTFSSGRKIRSHFGKLVIDGIEVEIMGGVQKHVDGWENPIDPSKYKRFIDIEGMKIPVLSLEYEYEAYLKLGRIERAEMLRRRLEGN